MVIEDIALTFVPGLGVRGAAHLLEVFSSAEAVYGAGEAALVEGAELRPDIARSISRKAGFAEAEREIRHCARNGIRAIASTDADYPPLLRECADRPHVLYMSGGDGGVLQAPMLSIVGTRRMTAYGERMCNRIVERIAEACPEAVIVSGLAFGSDAAAHRAALAFGLRTVGVVANALPAIVPAQNSGLARDMVARGGAVLTEINSQQRQNGNFYIPRNRIVAGMGLGLLVLESPADGGSMSTVKFADGYSRSVMALPARADDKASVGTNNLIRNHMAQLVMSGDDVLAELGWEGVPGQEMALHAETGGMNDAERRVLDAIPAGSTATMDEIVARSGMDVGDAAAILLNLELSGLVAALSGKRYERIG